MSYWRLFYHIVWATKGREPLIDAEHEATVTRIVQAVCRESGAVVHAMGFMPDHVHVAVSIPPRIAVSDFVQQLKGGSSYQMNRPDAWFRWQPEYGVVSFGERALPDVVAYVQNQRVRHAAEHLWPKFERIERDRGEALVQ
jgi:putative transposase